MEGVITETYIIEISEGVITKVGVGLDVGVCRLCSGNGTPRVTTKYLSVYVSIYKTNIHQYIKRNQL